MAKETKTKKVDKSFAVIRVASIYKEPKKGKVIGKVEQPNDTKFYNTTKQSGSYYYLEFFGGWIHVNSLKAGKTKTTKATTAKQKANAELARIREQTGKVEAQSFKAAINSMLKVEKKLKNGILDESTRLFGMPHRYNRFADMPISKTSQLGRSYAEKFATEAPILCLIPGRPNFMDNFKSAAERNGFLTGLLSEINDTGRDMNTAINKYMKNKDFKYYTFYTDFTSYMSYVNLMCRFSSLYLGVADTKAIEKDQKKYVKYSKYNWSYYRYHRSEKSPMKEAAKDMSGKSIFEKVGTKIKEGSKEFFKLVKETAQDRSQYVQFYVDPSTSYQETASNTTGESMVKSTIAEAEDKVKELSFIMNTGGAGFIDKMWKKSMNNVADTVNSWSLGGPLKRIFSGTSTILSGSSLYFPEIYKTSEFSRSYNVTINLTSPYGDKESLYLNIIVPLMHLFAFVLPKQNSANSYSAPFLVRASSKGLFSIDMGIVETMTIDKVQGSMTKWGIPTEVKVSMSIKDIYPAMMMSSSYAPFLFWENSAFRQWIAVMSGVDVTVPHTVEKLKAMKSMMESMVEDIPEVVETKVKEQVKQIWSNFTGSSV